MSGGWAHSVESVFEEGDQEVVPRQQESTCSPEVLQSTLSDILKDFWRRASGNQDPTKGNLEKGLVSYKGLRGFLQSKAVPCIYLLW